MEEEYLQLLDDLKSNKSFTEEEINNLINRDDIEINLAMALRYDLSEKQLLKLISYDTTNRIYSLRILISTRTDLTLPIKNVLMKYDDAPQWLLVVSNLRVLHLTV